MTKGSRSNNARSNSMNPNNPAYRASQANTARQAAASSGKGNQSNDARSNSMNPNNPAYKASKENTARQEEEKESESD